MLFAVFNDLLLFLLQCFIYIDVLVSELKLTANATTC